MTTAEKIRQHRLRKKINQDEMSGYLGFTQRAYSKIENDEVGIKMDRLEEVAKILNKQASELLAKDAKQHFENVQNSRIGDHNIMNNFNLCAEEGAKKNEEKEIEIMRLRELLQNAS